MTIEERCACPDNSAGVCKHVVAVLLAIATAPPRDESERVASVLQGVSTDDIQTFLRDRVAEQPNFRGQFLSCFDDVGKPAEA